MTCYKSASRPLDSLLEQPPGSFLFDYVQDQFESIISCPSPTKTLHNEYFSNSNNKEHYNNRSKDSLPSPPLSSSYQYNHHYEPTSTFDAPDTPPITPTFNISLRDYIEYVVTKSRIDTGTLICSLSYARRLKRKLSASSKGMECTHHRIFLATLIITSKYIHDSALKNKYWVGYSQLFSAAEINLMEKQLLQLLEYNLEISSDNYNNIVDDILQVQEQAYPNPSTTTFHLDRCTTPFSDSTTIYLSPNLSPCSYYSCSPTCLI